MSKGILRNNGGQQVVEVKYLNKRLSMTPAEGEVVER